jgi:hypothetical protein
MTWCNQNAYTAEAHEIIAYLALYFARLHWRDAERIRDQQHRRSARKPRGSTRT